MSMTEREIQELYGYWDNNPDIFKDNNTNKLELVDRAIESAQCRIYRLKANRGESISHQKKADNQIELQKITIKALKFYKEHLRFNDFLHDLFEKRWSEKMEQEE